MGAMARPGEWAVDSGTTHVQPPLTRATELIRAEIFRCLKQELPYRYDACLYVYIAIEIAIEIDIDLYKERTHQGKNIPLSEAGASL